MKCLQERFQRLLPALLAAGLCGAHAQTVTIPQFDLLDHNTPILQAKIPSGNADLSDKSNPANLALVGTSNKAQRGAVGNFEIAVEWAKSPKPTLPEPSGAAKSVRQKADEPTAIWSVQTDDKSLYHTINRWAQSANWQLMWEAERDFPIQVQIGIEGTFTAAIQMVMSSLAGTDYPLQAVMNDTTRVISIIRHQDPYAR